HLRSGNPGLRIGPETDSSLILPHRLVTGSLTQRPRVRDAIDPGGRVRTTLAKAVDSNSRPRRAEGEGEEPPPRKSCAAPRVSDARFRIASSRFRPWAARSFGVCRPYAAPFQKGWWRPGLPVYDTDDTSLI